VEEGDHRVQLPGRQRRAGQLGLEHGDVAVIHLDGSAGEGSVSPCRGAEGAEHRLVPVVDVGEAGHPRPQRGPAGGVAGQRGQRLVRRPHLAGPRPGQVAEHVVLAGEVLVDRDPRATGCLADAIERRALVAVLAEHVEGGVEDPLLGAQAAGAQRGVVRVRRPPRRDRGPVELVGHRRGPYQPESDIDVRQPVAGLL
jgi:hypothetical protein